MARGNGMRAAATWKIAAAYVGGIVGAGFASGQEIVQFFAGFGWRGLLGALGATALFALLGRIFTKLAYSMNTSSHRELLAGICGERWASFFDLALALFLWGTLAIMMAGAGALTREYLQTPLLYGILAMGLGVLLVLGFGVNGFLSLNLAMVGILLGITILIGSASLVAHGPENVRFLDPGTATAPGGGLIPNWWAAAALYASYNSSLMLALAASIGRAGGQTAGEQRAGERLVGERGALRQFAFGGFLGGASLGVLALFMTWVLLSAGEEVLHGTLPMYTIARSLGALPYYSYLLSLWIAMWATATSCTYSLSRRISRMLGLNWRAAAGVAVVVALGLARIGFTELLRTVYPAFGYVWFVFLLFLARYGLARHTCAKPTRRV